jgi:hypothetical protein
MDVSPDLAPEKIVWASSTANRRVPSFGMSGDCIYEPMWISDVFTEYQDRVMFIDPSGRGADETGICVASFSNGYVFIHELLGLEGGYDKSVLMRISKLAYQYDVGHIRVEANYGDAMFNSLLRPVIAESCGQVAIDEYKVTGQKERRILAALEPIMSQHRLVFDSKAARDETNQRQITRLTDRKGSLTHDDRVDVLSAACSYWEHYGIMILSMFKKNQEELLILVRPVGEGGLINGTNDYDDDWQCCIGRCTIVNGWRCCCC